MMQSYAPQPSAAALQPHASHSQPAAFNSSQHAASQPSFLSLRRPKDYLQRTNKFEGSQSSSVSAF